MRAPTVVPWQETCRACGSQRDWDVSSEGCVACGGRSLVIAAGHLIWQEVATLILIRRGVFIPPYRTSPAYGKGSRGEVVTSFALTRH